MNINSRTYISGHAYIGPDFGGLHEAAAPEMPKKALEPKYTDYIAPRQARRMSRILKMGVSAGLMALQKAGADSPDAIITATGLGCLQDSEKFLLNMTENNESLLNPTAFIQSTHNTAGAQLALAIGCKAHNITHSNKYTSFETALLEAMLMLELTETKNALVGGLDEFTDTLYDIMQRLGYWKGPNNKTSGDIPGEGAGFLLLSKEVGRGIYLDKLQLFHNQEISSLVLEAKALLNEMPEGIILYGGPATHRKMLKTEMEKQAFQQPLLDYSNYTGDFFTASAMACQMGIAALEEKETPEGNFLKSLASKPKNVLILNAYRNKINSLILLGRD